MAPPLAFELQEEMFVGDFGNYNLGVCEICDWIIIECIEGSLDVFSTAAFPFIV